MVLGNPHFPWDGPERFYQAAFHVNRPGFANDIEVAGGTLFGVPLILIGNTRFLAWSHTVSTAYRFTPIELKLVPGDPYSYFVDGVPRKMTFDEVTVPGFGTRRLYSSIYGPILTEILGLPLFPWTPATAFAMADANIDNFRVFNHFMETNQANSTAELLDILKRNQGIPWVNTIAADSQGWSLYADIGTVPNVPDAKVEVCSTALGVATFELLRLPVLDGSRSDCFWDNDPDAARKGIFGPSNMPYLRTKTYVTNSNDSYWLSNPDLPLEGFATIIGNERSTRSLRTRLGLRIMQDALDGSDGRGARGWDSVDDVAWAVFNNRQYAGELWRDELVEMCRQYALIPTRDGFVVNDGPACDALEGWDLRDDLDSTGAVLFRRFAGYALGQLVPYVGPFDPYDEGFDVFDPVNTPRGLDTENPQVIEALGRAINDLNRAGIAFDAPLGQWQYEKRGERRVPIHGGPGTVGVFNAINSSWRATPPESGYSNIPHGSSFVMAAHLDGYCPDVRTILTYSLSTNPNSPYFGDQTDQYSAKQWNTSPCFRWQAKPRGVRPSPCKPPGEVTQARRPWPVRCPRTGRTGPFGQGFHPLRVPAGMPDGVGETSGHAESSGPVRRAYPGLGHARRGLDAS
ncbi:MAG: penicillin acylase family protein [Actinomycetota bacterium]